MYLEKINGPEDVKKIKIDELPVLAQEIRDALLVRASKHGGHFGPNFGMVEATIALHYVFESPKDKIVFDVSHQSYPHKMLTGRKEAYLSEQHYDDVSGYTNPNESEHDFFTVGHTSTSVSLAAGLAKARDLKGENGNVIAVIGDGSLSGGEALEGLDFAAELQSNFIIIVNDNDMSIAENHGGLYQNLALLRKTDGQAECNLFKAMGLDYVYVDRGNDVAALIKAFKEVKDSTKPVVVHINTLKGKGYAPAEKCKEQWHYSGPFDIETGKPKKEKKPDYSKVFGEKIVEMAKKDSRIVAITASMKDGTGLTKFQKEFPNRFFDIGIAEQHALGMAAGMAKEGMIPVIPIYSSFYQRAYDQVIHDVAMQNLPVIMCVDRAGCVGADGETHQGTLDMAFFRLVPNLTIMAPKDFKELEDMLEFAVKLNKPVIIRYPRGGEDSKVKFERHENIELGKAEVLKKIIDEEKSNKTKILQKIGDKVFNNKTQRERLTIIAIGKMVARAMDIGQRLQEKMDVEVINARFLKPLDDNTIIESIKKTKNVITIEDGTIINGLATAVKEVIVNNNLQGVKIKSYAYPDEFIKHGSVDELEKIYGLDEENIINGVNKS